MAFLPQTWTIKNDILLLDAVKRVMRSAGIVGPATLEDASENVIMAISAVDAAARKIWYAARWDWRSFWIPLEIQDSALSAFTPLPDRYDASGANPVCGYLNRPLVPLSYAKLTQSVPTFALVPLAQMSGMTDLSEVLADFLADENNVGVPTHWGIHGSNLFLYPVFTEQSQAEDLGLPGTVIPVMFNFYATYEGAMDSIDDGQNRLINIPEHLSHILHHLACGYFQADLEYPGAGRNEGRGERDLAKAVASHRKLKRDDAQFVDSSDRRTW